MGKVTGFLEIDRQDRKYKPASDRVRNFNEFIIPLGESQTRDQAARCMDCGIPFCHTGCPVNNQIPDWNDLVYKNDWKKALENLHSTNNFPEFTGRICPAPCESSCTLNLNDEPVTIKTIECAIIDKGWKENWITPKISEIKTGKSIAIVGSGPAGLSCAQQLARQGHSVNVYEKNNKAGGLMRYGIPDFKMEKYLIERRVHQMEEEGVKFHYGVKIESKESIDQLINNYDAIVLAGGSESSRDLPITGRELNGVHFAMDFLPNQNRVVGNEEVDKSDMITAAGKNVVVIGGGDTGSDCIGTSFRQGALSVTQLEIMPIPPEKEDKLSTWPNWPLKFRTSSSQAEGASREFSIMTEEFYGDNGSLKALKCVRVDNEMKKIDGSEFEIKADLALLAMGFVHPVHTGIIDTLGIEKDSRGNILADTEKYLTNIDKFFAAGDMRRGQSLVVWAIREGRQAARSVDKFLMGKTNLAR
ncbi:MAG: glutamate synthase subunit beta [Alphaproteobacteria bacterium]|jgi:glutamate synthase (NADPH/NADH) small chain|tara:strand:+ start:22015 stop:23433 length:1419 start_codon:yes stop_codon:yes gene_type:complete